MESSTGKNITASVLGILLFAAILSVGSNNIQQHQSAQAQTQTSTIGSFSAKGTLDRHSFYHLIA